MRVNLIGTYNALEAALATKDSVERVIEFSTSEVLRHVRLQGRRAARHDPGSVGEARWTYAVSSSP